MSEEKKRSGVGKTKRKGATKKKESPQAEIKAEKIIEEGREAIKSEGESAETRITTETQNTNARTEISEGFSTSYTQHKMGIDSLIQLKEKVSNKIQAKIQIAKNMYSMFQGLKQSYGGDTKKVLAAIFSFAKEEAKRRLSETKSKLRKKIIGELD